MPTFRTFFFVEHSLFNTDKDIPDDAVETIVKITDIKGKYPIYRKAIAFSSPGLDKEHARK